MRIATIAAGCIAAAGLAAPAMAHVTLAQREAPAGRTWRATLVVGHGCDGAATTGLKVQIPPGFYNVKPMPKPGWTVETVTGPYDRPFDNHGTVMAEGVVEILWSGGSLPDSQFDEFTFRGSFGAEVGAGTEVWFPVIQQCGEREDGWTDTSGDEEAEMPAPHVTLTSAAERHRH